MHLRNCEDLKIWFVYNISNSNKTLCFSEIGQDTNIHMKSLPQNNHIFVGILCQGNDVFQCYTGMKTINVRIVLSEIGQDMSTVMKSLLQSSHIFVGMSCPEIDVYQWSVGTKHDCVYEENTREEDCCDVTSLSQLKGISAAGVRFDWMDYLKQNSYLNFF